MHSTASARGCWSRTTIWACWWSRRRWGGQLRPLGASHGDQPERHGDARGGRRRGAQGRRLAEPAPLLPDGLAGIADGETITLRPGGTSIVGATMSHFIERGVQVPFLTLVRLDDEMRRAERRGFTTAIRTMAHEVRNSFGAVDSALQTLTEIVDTAAIDADERADAIELIASSHARAWRAPPTSSAPLPHWHACPSRRWRWPTWPT